MGKTKQLKEKKFDRNVEISAPILDPEVIKQIHSPPKEQKNLDVRNGGFKALLSDLNSQDSTDEVTPILETNHLPSYIGISCAVSGYSNYSAYNKRSPENISNDTTRIESTRQGKITSANTRNTRGLSSPTRSQTNSPTTSRLDQHHIHHITIDRSNINSADQERKELTEKLTASASERRRSPSPLAPTEDDRHHGAYVGARYCPMPPPSKLVHKHIPLLGIDDDQDPDEFVEDDVNKVEGKIATLYGDEFADDWKESMSHKSKKEHFEDEQAKRNSEIVRNPKDLVTLKPTPAKTPEPENDAGKSVIDVPTPNVKVLAGVEKQFLNRLLTDENPPMPKPQTSQPTSPISSPKMVRQQQVEGEKRACTTPDAIKSSKPVDSVRVETLESQMDKQRSPSPAPESVASPDLQKPAEYQSHTSSPAPSPHSSVHNSPSPTKTSTTFNQEHDDMFGQEDKLIELDRAQSPVGVVDSFGSNNIQFQTKQQTSPTQELGGDQQQLSTSHLPTSPDSAKSQSIDDEANSRNEHQQVDSTGSVEHIEYEIRAQSPIDNQSSPMKVFDVNASQLVGNVKEVDNLVSFSPEPAEDAAEEAQQQQQLTQKLAEQEQASIENSTTKDLSSTSGDKDLATLAQTIEIESNQSKHLSSEVGEMNIPSGSPMVDEKINSNNNRDGHYFLNLLKQEESFIKSQVKLVEIMLAEHELEMDEDTLGRMRSAIGKANLLINKKCNQFRELCERGINRDSNEQYAVLNDDLAGFWDMLSIQISDVQKSFVELLNQ